MALAVATAAMRAAVLENIFEIWLFLVVSGTVGFELMLFLELSKIFIQNGVFKYCDHLRKSSD